MQIKQASALVVVPTTVFASSGRKTNQIALGWCCGVFRWCGPSPMAAEPSYCNCRVTSKGLCHIYLGLNFHLACFHLAPMHTNSRKTCVYVLQQNKAHIRIHEGARRGENSSSCARPSSRAGAIKLTLQSSLPLAINFPSVLRIPRDPSAF